ncbi:hypothetical protein Rfer_4335 (plasmid) [Rhodoferax ferrireducens T118]|uniref:Uncharacterized protein n=1 Tax=Albidiferax ferrireducens (strain ATCC BAA-621 / DSM 15236 / T118) TaxID=338969 RepID=Q21QC4_ALBFT|nr:hypothetical protein [Rhodoferax ferrireducens]ABD72021.1 hypothetical protein Rfer_4335 [Rhodoferax ferrireducens T118]
MGFLAYPTAISKIIWDMRVFQELLGDEVSDQLLCERFGVEVYRVRDTCFGEYPEDWLEVQDLDKFFVSTLAGSFDAEVVKAIPLAISVDKAQSLAVGHLGLRELPLPMARPTFSHETVELQSGEEVN